MADEAAQLELMQVTIGCGHTISTAPFENIKVEASLTFGIRRGTTDEQFKPIMQSAQAKLKEILRETYLSQRRPKQEAE